MTKTNWLLGTDAYAQRDANNLMHYCHDAMVKVGWWHKDGQHLIDVDGTVEKKLLLIHSEISEATEGQRKDLMDDKLPHRKMVEVELADALIRIFDLAGAMKLDIGGALAEKMVFNRARADHKPENRSVHPWYVYHRFHHQSCFRKIWMAGLTQS